ncbi:UNVERIFIED_CONTAM: hypothetical protein Sradi_7047300 [Sesamum radiatum]|uniref:DUF4283 domain-containing protein n=1 Tax=Sesamum radiatum TaxID=300843 RepID=A0AAW2J7L8_SESRA
MDEGEDGDLVDGSHGAVSAVPVNVPSTGDGATMVDKTEHGKLDNEGHGAGPPVPMTPTTAEGDSTTEKLMAEFNIKEFFELASRVIDDGDSESMEMLKNLKNKWMEKLGGELNLAGNGGFRPVHARTPTPFPEPTLRKARRVLRNAAPAQTLAVIGPLAAASLKTPLSAVACASTDDKDELGLQDPAHAAWAVRNEPPTSVLGDALTLAARERLHPIEPTKPLGQGDSKPSVSHVPVDLKAITTIDGSRHQLPASPTTFSTALKPVAVPLTSATAASASRSAMDDSLKTMAPPLLECQTELPCSKVEIVAVQQPEASVTAATRGRVEMRCPPPRVVPAATGTLSPMSSTGIFIGNVPLHTPGSDFSCDKFAASFNNSTRKTLSYTEIAMEEVIEGGPWLFQGQPIVLQRWEPGMVLRKHKHTQVPVWIRLRHLPVEFWTDDGLSTVASGVGRPLYQDTITRACTRLDFARVCVMLDISSTLPKHLIIMMPREDGTEVPCKVEVEYEWVPPKCKNCMSLGHSTSACPDDRKIDKPPVSVYVQKRTVQPSVSRPDVTKGADRNPSVAREDGAGEDANGAAHDEVIDKGKAVVVYNPFDFIAR